MVEVFPEPIRRLPHADIPLRGLLAYLLQGNDQQVLFMQFEEDVDVPVHAHESQWSVVLNGRIDINIEGANCTYEQGDRFFIPRGVRHSARIYAGYADITFFDEKSRYSAK